MCSWICYHLKNMMIFTIRFDSELFNTRYRRTSISRIPREWENASSFPKFEIANYDVTRVHVHEQKCVHFRLNTLSSFRKICIATKRLYVCNPLCTIHTFYQQISGSLNVNKENPVKILPTYAIARIHL